MPIINLKKVNKAIQEIKKSFEKLNHAEKAEVDFWYQKWRDSYIVMEVRK